MRELSPSMPNRAVLVLAAVLAAGCATEKQKERSARLTAEGEVVSAVDGGSVKSLQALLRSDPTLANSATWIAAARRDGEVAETALTLAIKKNRRDLVDPLLAAGADLTLLNTEGRTPLLVALHLPAPERLAMVKLLLEKGADPALGDSRGSSPIHELSSVRESDPAKAEIRELFLAKLTGGGRPDRRGYTPLHHAAQANEPADIRALVAHGSDPNVKTIAPDPAVAWEEDHPGVTPLALVARDRQIAAAATLCALGADPTVPDSRHASPRDVAATVAAAEAAKPHPIDVDLARHRNMAAFLAAGGGCEALLARFRKGETIPPPEVLRIANESECGAGWGWACGQAGWAYHRGEGAKEDDAKAYALFRKGCEGALTKSEWCCGMTGIAFVDGNGVAKDPEEGARWLSKGCEPADPKRADEQACNRLGLLYAEGVGVRKDLPRARTLFKKACEGKYDRACANLAKYAGT